MEENARRDERRDERRGEKQAWTGRWWSQAAAATALAIALLGGIGSGAQAAAPLDLNRASAEELARLPGIGPARAEAIVARRDAVAFESVEELLAIRGIGDTVFAGLRDQVVVVRPVGPATAPAPKPLVELPEALE